MIRNHIHASSEMGIPDSPERPGPRAAEPAEPRTPVSSAAGSKDERPRTERERDGGATEPIEPPPIDYKGEGPGAGGSADANAGSEGGRRPSVVKNLPTLEAKPGPIRSMHSIDTPRRKILMSDDPPTSSAKKVLDPLAAAAKSDRAYEPANPERGDKEASVDIFQTPADKKHVLTPMTAESKRSGSGSSRPRRSSRASRESWENRDPDVDRPCEPMEPRGIDAKDLPTPTKHEFKLESMAAIGKPADFKLDSPTDVTAEILNSAQRERFSPTDPRAKDRRPSLQTLRPMPALPAHR